MVYEELKSSMLQHSGRKRLTAEQTCCAASMSKIFGTVVTYPIQVARTRLQQGDPVDSCRLPAPPPGPLLLPYPPAAGRRSNRGMSSVLVQIARVEGVAALYRGMGANLLRVVPATAATFVVYERVAAVLDEGGVMKVLHTKR
mmetsp:Transcript_44701/g.93586  ORF Transcript_44701/g.93586 Transcript_44701/m.93586 type:complete len:143 (-) Transcript_44701:5-433(-)